MLRLSKMPNSLQLKVDEPGWDQKKVVYNKIEDSSDLDFPRLTMDELRWVTMGVYQLKQSKSYTRVSLLYKGFWNF